MACIGLLLATLVWLDVPKLNAREWKDASGKFKVEAVFVRFVGDEVELKKSDGKLIKVPVVSPTKRAVSQTRPAYCSRTFDITIACSGAGGRVGFEINASRAGPLMRYVLALKAKP